MAYSEQFTCDVCNAVRQASNNWYIIRFGFPSIIILAFDVREYKGYSRLHQQVSLCGGACVSKWVSQNLASLHSESKTAASQTVLENVKFCNVICNCDDCKEQRTAREAK